MQQQPEQQPQPRQPGQQQPGQLQPMQQQQQQRQPQQPGQPQPRQQQPEQQQQQPPSDVAAVLPRLWSVPWTNTAKEPFWRLLYDAFPTPVRLHRKDPFCPCGAVYADSKHCFWHCPTALAVREEIEQGAASATKPFALQPSHIWLADTPPGLEEGVWDVVVLAAVGAMDKGRRCMMRAHLKAAAAETDEHDAPPAHVVGAQQARRAFWELLHDFASLRHLPRGAYTVGPESTSPTDPLHHHPFLCRAALGVNRVKVNSK